jgi:hypothetical protein
MSPELAFLLSLALKMAVTAAFVVTASMITERVGAVIGALVSTLPFTAGPAYIFLAIAHDSSFIAQSALATLNVNAATTVYGLVYVLLAQRYGLAVSLTIAMSLWCALTAFIGMGPVSFPTALLLNAVAFALCLPLASKFRSVKMPLIKRRWYDVPLRAGMVAALVATVVTLSNYVGASWTGVIATFPLGLTSLMLIFQPRIGGPAAAAVIANMLWGLIGFGLAGAVLHITAVPLGSPPALCLALAAAVSWNMMLWQLQRRGRWG